MHGGDKRCDGRGLTTHWTGLSFPNLLRGPPGESEFNLRHRPSPLEELCTLWYYPCVSGPFCSFLTMPSSSSRSADADSVRNPRRYHERPINPPSVKTVHPRPLKPLTSPPKTLLLHPPALPECGKARLASTDPQSDDIFRFFDVSTHVIPAAYPRLTPFVPFSELERKAGGFPGNETKKSRTKRAAHIAEELRRLRDDYAKGLFTLDGSENRLLWNVANRYTRKKSDTGTNRNRKSVTLLLAHATGFPKEVR